MPLISITIPHILLENIFLYLQDNLGSTIIIPLRHNTLQDSGCGLYYLFEMMPLPGSVFGGCGQIDEIITG